jgi:hypothetical protein
LTYSPSIFIRPMAQASGFAIEKMFQFRDVMQLTSMIQAEPEVWGDPVKRIRWYNKIAKIKGENWDKMLYDILPTEEELQRKKFLRRHLQKKMQVMGNAAKQAAGKGVPQEQAMEIGKNAGKQYDQMAEVNPEELADAQDDMMREQQAILQAQPKRKRK